MTHSSSDERRKSHGEISLGDLVHALTLTQVGDIKEALTWAIEMLDLPPMLLDSLSLEPNAQTRTKKVVKSKSKFQASQKEKYSDTENLPTDALITYGIVKSRRIEIRDQRPEWLESAVSIPPVTDIEIEMRPSLEPLFNPNTTRAIISAAFATRREEGPIDFVKLLDKISSQQPIKELSRQSITTLRFGVQLLIDRGQGTWPFYGDQERMRKDILGVVGRDRVETLYFSESPLRGLGPGSLRTWKLPYEPPVTGTPVVILTDLGIARRRKTDLGASVEEWLHFAQIIYDAQCPMLALVPYAEHRWPKLLVDAMYIIPWDRSTNVSVIRRMVGQGLEVIAGP